MKLKGEFEVVSIGDETMAVPVGEGNEDMHGVLRLNDSGVEVFGMLKNEISEAEIIDALCAKYENGRDEISAFVREFLATLSESGVLC